MSNNFPRKMNGITFCNGMFADYRETLLNELYPIIKNKIIEELCVQLKEEIKREIYKQLYDDLYKQLYDVLYKQFSMKTNEEYYNLEWEVAQ